MKRKVALIIVLALVASLFVGCGQGTEQNEPDNDTTEQATTEGTDSPKKEPVKIALFDGITGAHAPGVKLGVNGAKLAVKHVNEAGGVLGGREIELVLVDSTDDTTRAPLILEDALSSQKISGVVGSNASSLALTQLPVLEKYKVPALLGSVNVKITSSGYSFIFRPGCIGDQMGKVNVELLQYLAEKSGKPVEDFKVGIVYEDSAYGADTAAGYKTHCENAGLPVVVEESYPALKLTDASPIVTKLKNADVQVVMAACLTGDAKLLVNTMKSMQYQPMLFGGGSGFIWPPLYDELGENVNGIISSSCWNWDQTNNYKIEEWEDICKEYEETYGEFPAEHAGEMYAFVRIFADAIDKADSDDPIAIRDILRTLSVDNCKWMVLIPEGNVKIDPETGQGIGSNAVMIQWQDNVPKTIWPREISSVDIIGITGNVFEE